MLLGPVSVLFHQLSKGFLYPWLPNLVATLYPWQQGTVVHSRSAILIVFSGRCSFHGGTQTKGGTLQRTTHPPTRGGCIGFIAPFIPPSSLKRLDFFLFCPCSFHQATAQALVQTQSISLAPVRWEVRLEDPRGPFWNLGIYKCGQGSWERHRVNAETPLSLFPSSIAAERQGTDSAFGQCRPNAVGTDRLPPGLRLPHCYHDARSLPGARRGVTIASHGSVVGPFPAGRLTASQIGLRPSER